MRTIVFWGSILGSPYFVLLVVERAPTLEKKNMVGAYTVVSLSMPLHRNLQNPKTATAATAETSIAEEVGAPGATVVVAMACSTRSSSNSSGVGAIVRLTVDDNEWFAT